MDDDLRQWLFDPGDAHRLVLARRPPDASAMTSVVSDVVWHDVVHLLRWSAATTGSTDVDAARWWRVAAARAHLLPRAPPPRGQLRGARGGGAPLPRGR